MTDELKHGLYSTYKNKKCRCDLCKAASAAYSREARRRRAEKSDPTVPKAKFTRVSQSDLERARYFLEDGCSYPEAAETTGIHAETLRRRLPGYTRQGRINMFDIHKNASLGKLLKEIQSIDLPEEWPENYKG